MQQLFFPAFATLLILILSGTQGDAMMNVRDLGAEGNGTTDDTGAFQAALERAGESGDVVLVPPGRYRIDGTLEVPVGVTLEGVWRGPHTTHLDKGSVLLAYAGRDTEDATPFIRLQTGSTLKGLTIFYPEQKATDVRPYPWTIQGRGQHYNVIDVTIGNAYNGIDCGTYHNEGHHLRNVHLCALRRGVFIDQCTDIGRLENVHIHNVYWWRASAPYAPTREETDALQRYTPQHLEGFIIGRTDWEYMSGCFVIWAKVGLRFIQTTSRVGGLGNVVITQSGSDIGPLAVKVERVQDHAGIAFENCQLMSGFEIGPDNRGPVKLTNCGFWGQAEAGSQMVLAGQGTVFLTACHFSEWDPERPAIRADAGTLLVTGCDFMGLESARAHIHLGTAVRSAAIVANRFRHGGLKLVNESGGEVQVLGNVGR